MQKPPYRWLLCFDSDSELTVMKKTHGLRVWGIRILGVKQQSPEPLHLTKVLHPDHFHSYNSRAAAYHQSI